MIMQIPGGGVILARDFLPLMLVLFRPSPARPDPISCSKDTGAFFFAAREHRPSMQVFRSIGDEPKSPRQRDGKFLA
jgi:hypothetical protein